MRVSSIVLQNEERAVIIFPKVHRFLLKKITLLRIVYCKERYAVSIVARRDNR